MTDEGQERSVRVRLLTERGWLEATLRLPRMARLVDWLNREARFLTLTDVRAAEVVVPYLSLRRSAVRLAAPLQAEDVSSYVTGGAPTARTVLCLLSDGAVRGKLDVLEHVRVSDFLAHHSGFVGLRDAHLHRIDATGSEVHEDLVDAIVQLDLVLGAAEGL